MLKKALLSLGLALAITATAFAAETAKTEKGDRYTISYPVFTLENTQAAKKINKDIRQLALRTKTKVESKEPFYLNVGTNYEIISENDSYISLVLVSWDFAGGAHGMHYDYGLVYDKATGERLPYTHFAKEISAAELYDGIAGKQFTVYCADLQTVSDAPFLELIKKEEFKVSEYFILKNGKAYLMYPPYELDCYAAGTTYVELP